MDEIDEEKFSKWKIFVDNEYRKILKDTNYSNLDVSILLGRILYALIIRQKISPEKLEKLLEIPEEKYFKIIITMITRIIKIFEEAKQFEPDYEDN